MPALRRSDLTFLVVFLITLVTGAALRAELVWDANAGWRVEGGVFAGALDDEQARSAKDIMDVSRRAEDAGDLGKALKGYKRVAKRYKSSVYAAEALFRAARIYEQRRQYGSAFKRLQTLVAEHPAYPKFLEVLGIQYRIAEKLSAGARPRYFGIIPGFKQRAKGLEFFETVVQNAPYSEYAPLALMNAAGAYSETGDREAAIDALDRMINNYPDSFLTPDAYLKLAAAQASITQGPPYDQASTQLALTYFQDYLILYPGEADATVASTGFADARTMLAESKMTIGDFYFNKRSNFKAAKVFYNEAITIYPESPTAERARTLLARIDQLETKAQSTGSEAPNAPRSKRFWLF